MSDRPLRAKIAAFSQRGVETALAISRALGGCEVSAPAKFCAGGAASPIGSLAEWTSRAFASCDALIFVSAAGIAVRAIAPHIRGKDIDPAVVAVDERATFAIALLSGHIGGANELAERVAEAVGAVPVITTATDVNSAFSVDSFARANGLAVTDLAIAKEISSAVLAGETVGLVSDVPIAGEAPPGVALCLPGSPTPRLGAAIGADMSVEPFERTLHLVPADHFIGMGCRRGKDADALEALFCAALRELGIGRERVAAIASIDVKSGEPGLLELSSRLGIRFITFSADELNSLPGRFSGSEFVAGAVGVECVCERAALLASRGGELIMKKTARDGATIAAARAPRLEEVRFGQALCGRHRPGKQGQDDC